jgi:hypothetical protein
MAENCCLIFVLYHLVHIIIKPLYMKKTLLHPILVATTLTLIAFYWSACIKSGPTEVVGFKPVYADPATIRDISNGPARTIVNGGKIYAYKNWAFQIENGEGIHVMDMSQPNQPVKLGFIKIHGCSEISIQNDVLYSDNDRDLVCINISQYPSISLSSRIEKIFPGVSQEIPPYAGVYFECVDPSKGQVIGWTEVLLTNPKCKR